jgi:hypothetical protein
MDGWRGSRLGYAGGRTGYMANYGNNDALRGTLGQTTYSSAAYNSADRNQAVTGNALTLVVLAGAGLLFGPSLMSVGKDIRKKAANAAQRAQNAIKG